MLFRSNITGNTNYGIQNLTGVEVDATNNWWGSAFAAAIADMVDGDVDYSPWLDAAYPYGKSTTTDGFTIDLLAGWNLISLPLIPTDSDIETVLADLIGEDTVIQVRTFLWEAGELGEKYWIPATSTLSQMEDGWGYWIEMSAADALVVTGSEYPAAGGMQPSYDLNIGWNLIGFKSLLTETPSSYLDDLGTDIQAIYGYDAVAGVYFIPGDDPKLAPGMGYWVAVSAEGTIYP